MTLNACIDSERSVRRERGSAHRRARSTSVRIYIKRSGHDRLSGDLPENRTRFSRFVGLREWMGGAREESDKGEEMGSRTRGLEGRRGRSVVGSLLQRKEPAPHGVAHQFGVVLEAEFPHQVARWFSTVRWLIWSRAAISPPVFPSAASWRTSRSRAVNVSWGSIWAARDCSI